MVFLQKVQERMLRTKTQHVIAVIKQQWNDYLTRYGDVGALGDLDSLGGLMELPLLNGRQMSVLHREVKQCAAREGIPVRVTLEREGTAIAWQHAPVGVS